MIAEADRKFDPAGGYGPLLSSPETVDDTSDIPPLRVLGIDPERNFAGGETQVLGLTMRLQRHGHQAELACDPRGQLYQRAQAAGIECHPLAIRNAVDFAAAMRLRSLLSRRRYDIVHFHTSRAHSMAPFVSGLARATVVTRRMDYRPNRLFAPLLYNRAVDGVGAISTKVADALIEAGVARRRLQIIPSGVDCELFSPPTSEQREQARAQIGIRREDVLVGTVGMLEERKGHHYLLEAIGILNRRREPSSRLKCAIVGDGGMRDELTALAGKLGIGNDTFFLGMMGDTRRLLDALDLFVFPSVKEGLGVALLEAMACGLPVIAASSGGIVDIVEANKSGLLVPSRDAASIADAIASLADDPSHRAKLGLKARARVIASFSMDAMTAGTLKLYRTCLMRRGRGEGARH